VKPFSRRAVLRGALGSLALPLLERALNGNGTAFANGAPLPLRFGTWWFGVGVRLDRWTPPATGSGYPLTDELQPLAPVKDAVSVVSGLDSPFPGVLGHHDGWVSMLTGSNETTNAGRPGDGNFIRPTLDQVVADAWHGQTPFDSLQLTVSRRGAASNDQYCTAISQRGNDQPMPGLWNPADVFARLFSNVQGGPDPRLIQAKGSVLDTFQADGAALRTRLGTHDRMRLDAYLSSVRSIEARLQMTPVSTCMKPGAPADFGGEDLGTEAVVTRGRLLADLLVAALQCDLTRVFSFEWSPMQAMTLFHDIGLSDGYHTITHEDQNAVHNAVVYAMGELSYLLQRLQAASDPAGGTLLDSLCMFTSTEVAQGDTHQLNDMPILISGTARGALRGGVHHRGNGEPTTQAQLTALRAVGLGQSGFGYNQGATNTVLSALLP
jgi:hypothetical protein